MRTDSDADGSGGGTTADAGGGTNDGGRADDGEPVLHAADVHKSYGDVTALSGADLAVGRGEVFGLIGPNGAGKTTLVRALTGTTSVDGTVRVLGAQPAAVDPERIGLLPQSFDPPGRLTARELVSYYAGLYTDARDVDAVLADVGLESDADAWYETLSGGQRRRACVATALVNDPDVLFLDEPTTGIDPAGRRDIHRVIRAAAAAGTTVFLTSHAMGEVEQLADRVGLMREGTIVAVGSPASLIAEYGGHPTLSVTLEIPETDEPTDAVTAREAGVAAIRTNTHFEIRERGAHADSVADPTAGQTADGTHGTAIEVDDVPLEGINDVLDALTAAEIDIESVSWSEPSLEDVYLELTGEAYRPTGTGESVDTADSTAGSGPSSSRAATDGGSR
ncbi:ABC transporter ATP-binding protein [Halopenitus sp. POP-27]|uniref:ABC transporter ATP-binding protein n=1 Tax=Halopenitus sp. POP-27 TaxID=2994425 RepID=UPI002468A67C|nr:ABC transporter ATP-binding protein [Halopenitus sp. POP-27]